MDKSRHPEYKKLERKFRKYWLNILQTTELNIFHKQKYNRDLTELQNF